MNIGVLTSGGDSPGMNAAIRAVARQGFALGARVVGFRHGLDGIFKSDYIELTPRGVGGVLDQGGTFLGTGRSSRFREEGGPQLALDALAAADVDSLAIIGGDGSMRAALSLPDARNLLRRLRPRAVLSIGGYAAGPLSIAAWLLRVTV